MRVLYLHQYFQTREQAGSTRSYEQARRLVARGHQVTIISGNIHYSTGEVVAPPPGWLARRQRVEGIEVIWLPVLFSYKRSYRIRTLAFALYAIEATIAGLFAQRPDVVFATSPPLTIALPALITCILRRCPLVFEVRDLWPEAPVKLGVLRNRWLVRLFSWLETLVYRRSQVIVAVTPGIKRRLRERGWPAEKVALILHGADMDLFDGVGAREEVRRALGYEQEFVVVFAGKIGVIDAVHVLVEAMARLREEPGVLCVVIGDGPRRAAMEARAHALGLANVRFLGALPKSETARHIVAADVAVVSVLNSPVLRMVCSNKFCDYLAAGKAIVINFEGDLAEIVAEHQVGLYAGPNDPDGLAGALVKLKRDPVLREAMGRRARRLAEEVFARDKQLKKLERVLLESAAGCARRLGGERGSE